MKMTVWGARGSTPVSGAETVRYGGDTSCLEVITSAGKSVIFDAGTGIRQLGKKLQAQGQNDIHLFLSHAHWDHLLGFPFFRPLYSTETTIYLHGWGPASKVENSLISASMEPPFFPIKLDCAGASVRVDLETREWNVLGLNVRSVPLSHPNGGYGFIVRENGKSMAFLPDNELGLVHEQGGTADDYVEWLQGVDLLIHDAEYRREEYESFSRGWGHSIFTETIELARKARVKKLLLWHLNQDRTDDGLDKVLEEARSLAPEIEIEMARTGLSLTV